MTHPRVAVQNPTRHSGSNKTIISRLPSLQVFGPVLGSAHAPRIAAVFCDSDRRNSNHLPLFVFLLYDRYSDALSYWDGVDPSVEGMLGGFGALTAPDVAGSRAFLEKLWQGKMNSYLSHSSICGSETFLMLPHSHPAPRLRQHAQTWADNLPSTAEGGLGA